MTQHRFLLVLIAVSRLLGGELYPAARFTDPQRASKLTKAFPGIDEIFREYAAAKHIRGMVWGVVIDGQLAHVQSVGDRITADTPFRIASMTKSFTALAILKLRDEGKLSLEDPVAKWIPEFARMEMPTRDSPVLRIRHLLTHSAGFPEDNPWGDQQLGASEEELTKWLQRGIPFSTTPGTRYEYSNYGFALLGRIVTKAAGVPYDRFVTENILKPLQMTASTFDAAKAGAKATGYRLQPDGTYLEEPQLPHGAFGAMGGLLTTANDLGRYVAFHLSAWPPRDEPENGPVRRSSVREMNHLWNPANLTGGKLPTEVRGYGYGLRISADCRFYHIVGHGGGLPGFGSYMAWLPDYGVGMFAMANLTYVGPAQPINQAWDVLLQTGGLQKRELPPSPMLTQARDRIFDLWKSWNVEDLKKIAAINLLLDMPAAQRELRFSSSNPK